MRGLKDRYLTPFSKTVSVKKIICTIFLLRDLQGNIRSRGLVCERAEAKQDPCKNEASQRQGSKKNPIQKTKSTKPNPKNPQKNPT